MYLSFGGKQYYASGGGYDLLGTAVELNEANRTAELFIGKRAITEICDDDRELDLWYEIEWTHVVAVIAGSPVMVMKKFGARPYGNGDICVEICDNPDFKEPASS